MEHEHKPTIKEWTADEQPRERLEKKGPRELRDAELLAILLRSGTREANAIEISQQLLREFGSLTKLSNADLGSLTKIHGIGLTKAVTLLAAFELGKRIESHDFDPKESITEPGKVAEHFIPLLRDLKQEQFHVIFLNTANQMVHEEMISQGGLNASVVTPREVFRQAIVHQAAGVILVHNHPSGNPEPSREDVALTKSFVAAGELLHVRVHDHLIIAGNTYTSLQQRRLM